MTDFVLSVLRSPLNENFISIEVLLMFSFYFHFFPWVSISLLPLSICFYMFYTFCFRILNILITVILNFCLVIPPLCRIWLGLWWLLCLFRLLSSCFFGMPCKFLLGARYVVLEISYANSSLVGRFMIIFHESGLFLMFAVAISAKGFNFLECLCFYFFSTLGFPK